MTSNVDTAFKSPVVLSLCPGIRGLERGIERAIGPIDIVAYVEIEAFIIANLVAAMEAGILAPAPIWTDVKTFNPQPFRGKVHGVIGGYPCQPFSTAGKQNGESDPRHLWPHIREHIRAIKPGWCFFENVANHLNIGFETVLRDLQEMGYRVEAGIFSAAEVGAPHLRKRLFILAVEHTRNIGEQPICEISTRRYAPKLSSQELAYTEIVGQREPHNQADAKPRERESWQILSQRSPELADNSGKGLPFVSREQQRCIRKPNESFTWSDDSRISTTSWPSRPGEPQHEWESPRVISREVESELGIRTHGYNFREDFLRALGNSVVEQQAEFAFRTLINKFK